MLRWLTLALLATGMMVTSTVFAATTSRLEGTVVNDQHEPLAGVTVTISSESLIGGPRSAVTGDQGAFTFHLLSVGNYTVEANLVGYTPATAEVPVRLDRTSSVILRLTPTTFASEISVTAEVPIVDATRTNTGEVFGLEYMQNASIGSSGRIYFVFMNQAAGAVSPGNNASVSVLGATPTENAYIIDGLDTTDPSIGWWSDWIPLDAVEEVSVLTGGLDASFGYGTGGDHEHDHQVGRQPLLGHRRRPIPG